MMESSSQVVPAGPRELLQKPPTNQRQQQQENMRRSPAILTFRENARNSAVIEHTYTLLDNIDKRSVRSACLGSI